MGKTAKPIEFVLTQSEADILSEPAGAGGQQGFHQQLRDQLQNGNLTIRLDDDQVGKLIRYATQYGPGGFQGRLRKAFGRTLRTLLSA